jgi:hypothetical protein
MRASGANVNAKELLTHEKDVVVDKLGFVGQTDKRSVGAPKVCQDNMVLFPRKAAM